MRSFLTRHFNVAWVRVAGALALLSVASFAYWYATRSVPPPFVLGQGSSHDAQRAYWTDRIQTIGGTAAYQAFSRWASENPLSSQHPLAHAFGEALYDLMGEQGVSVCDSQFSYGCFHIVLGKAIAERGLSSVGALDAVCRSSLLKGPEACEHGIGHGVATYLGYTEDALVQALGVCDGLTEPTARLGCYSGVFMEYNTRTMLGVLATPREVVDGDLLAPCNTLAAQYRDTCAFWQPQWWMHGVYRTDVRSESMYKMIGGLCDKIGSASSVRACYEGLGNITPQNVGYSPAAGAVLCRASTPSKLNQLYCISSVAYVIGGESSHSEGRQACAGLVGVAQSFCFDYADTKAHMFNPKSAPALEDL